MKLCDNCDEAEATTEHECLGDCCQACFDDFEANDPGSWRDEREDFHADG